MNSIFSIVAQYGRFVLILGLVAGVTMPDLAVSMRPWLRELVMLLLAFTAFRVGFKAVLETLADIKETLLVVLIYQVLFPVGAALFLTAIGLSDTPVAMVITLLLAAPSITGSPSFAIMLGHRPEPNFKILVIGTLIFPVTIIPVLFFLPAAGSIREVFGLSIELAATLGIAIAVGFLAREIIISNVTPKEKITLDGISTVLLAVIVVGLMSAVVPTFNETPSNVIFWLVLAFSVNYGLQFFTYIAFRAFSVSANNSSVSIIAGNRNVAIFLVASAVSNSDEFLIFLGCYQLPMYLTPTLMRWLYKN